MSPFWLGLITGAASVIVLEFFGLSGNRHIGTGTVMIDENKSGTGN